MAAKKEPPLSDEERARRVEWGRRHGFWYQDRRGGDFDAKTVKEFYRKSIDGCMVSL
jgi:hypothetical protein